MVSGGMSSNQLAFSHLFQQLIELYVIKIDTGPLDTLIEWRLKEFLINIGLSNSIYWLILERVSNLFKF